MKTCVIFYSYKTDKQDDEWISDIEYCEFDNEKGETAFMIIKSLIRWCKQSVAAYKIDNVVIG